MSIRIPGLGFRLPKATAPQAEDAWSPRRYRWGLRQVRRRRLRNGRSEWYFPGQEADEKVRSVVRKHPWFLIKPALPVVASFGAFFALMAFDNRLPSLHLIWFVLEVIAVLAGLAFGALFLYKDLILWTVETTIITNKRIITWRTREGNFLHPERQVTSLDKVTQVSIIQETLWSTLLEYGTVHIYLTGGQVRIEDVPTPREVKDTISGISEAFKAKKPPKEQPLVPNDARMAAVLAELGTNEKVEELVDIDKKLYGLPHPDRLLGPRRKLGGPLRIPLNIVYSSGEFTVKYIQRSRWVLIEYLVLPILALIAVVTVTSLLPALAFITGPIVLIILIVIFLLVIRYLDDIYILTNKRIIDIDRKFIFFYEARVETDYKNVRDVKVELNNVLDNFLDIGNLEVETPGANPNILFKTVAHPLFLQDKIYEIKDHEEKAKKAKDKNDDREDRRIWFGKVITALEQKLQDEGAPNLENLDFLSAADRASALGLQIVVMGEVLVHSGQPSGRVVQQNPTPGTMINSGGVIQVLLSKRA